MLEPWPGGIFCPHLASCLLLPPPLCFQHQCTSHLDQLTDILVNSSRVTLELLPRKPHPPPLIRHGWAGECVI